MRSNKVLLPVFFFLGLALLGGAFFLFVPEGSRTETAWMNIAVVAMIYCAFWLRYWLLYRKKDEFADGIPALAIGWAGTGTYATAALCAMVVMHIADVGFDKQALLQACLLFVYGLSLAIGIIASNFVEASGARAKECLGSIQEMRDAISQVTAKVSFAYAACPRVLEACRSAADEIDCICGCNAPEARKSERAILLVLDEMETLTENRADEDAILGAIARLNQAVAVRKVFKNV